MMSDLPLIESQILASLFYDDIYSKRALPHLKDEYFESEGARVVVRLVRDFVGKYSKQPTVDAIAIDLASEAGLSQQQFNMSKDVLASITKVDVDREWLVDQSEKWCQDRALYLGIMQSIQILDQKESTTNGISRGAIPSILQDALSTNFDRSIGHDYLEEYQSRYDYYHDAEERVPFDIDMLNKITDDGITKKSLTIIIAGTGVGKTLAMGHMAAANLMHGRNVLYITMEMSEKRIAQRIDANLMDVDIHDLKNLSRADFDMRIARVHSHTMGRLVIKEFATGSASVMNFRHLISELTLKKHFVPDIIYVDYMNICASARHLGKDANSYTIVKSVAEELRGLAVDCNVPLVTATQFNRKGSDSSDPGLGDTSDSFGTPMTADLMFALYSSPELDEQHKIMVKQLKNRYNPIEEYRRFMIGIDKSHMRLSNCDNSVDGDTAGNTPVPLYNGPKVPVIDATEFNYE